MAGLKQSDVL